MKTLILKLVALGGMIALVAALWPIFTEAETSLVIIFVVLSMAGIGIAALAMFSKKRWLLWAALGAWPGALIGGLVFAGIALLTVSNGTTGWEGVIVGVVIILGVFVGSVAGAITGGVLGARKTRQANSAS
ncbi:hypothetical protein [Candidatus Lucifugimonas marina]|uniref:TIGR04086 family membrane protein n=1 Tax=Candidatus Lucifugimonas marina TaxID=3038979 RepID=A0AAJ6CT84_9CHLR|nr:hypothetical protein [SAR202 cluster bacterium JH702]MDG0868618.1 hypothetical protein [SAR202 cluster bacterium JH639]WFG35252.1 hypothetical protein GKN94_05945 [SAR202 cluster bacterium JH545]WFG39202.1 hypothetical protein GKO48_06075 [SAR202 cluster bacterium JH1073]